ncbi:3'-5' exonuclease [Akkermansia muciniphila]|nr:DNA polymerase III subunit epsilon [Akkermansia muciniphila]QHV64848.1 3'-5' exonuclease [Akkermansia muciniphila]QHV67297.1 3'-5' exonuclease [Akkermansia muciniphila]QHV69764.1 3'-5' exonuclease [Akkermansia muciniphila]QHV72217.1 3'-5' exonuclease [Akkermansia muciniphila]
MLSWSCSDMPLLSDTIGGLHFAAIDFESAGAARGETDQPVQIGIAACPRLEDEPELWTSYIAVEKPVLWSASQVHGITTEMLADAPSFPSLWPEIRSRLGQAVVVGHNPATERKFLRRFPGHGFGPWLDTLALGRMCVPGLADYSLSSLCGALGLTCSVEALLPARRWHDALYDALASLLIVRFLVKELNLSGQPLEVLGKAVRT